MILLNNKKTYEPPMADVRIVKSADIVCESPITLPFIPFDETQEEDW